MFLHCREWIFLKKVETKIGWNDYKSMFKQKLILNTNLQQKLKIDNQIELKMGERKEILLEIQERT